MDLLCFSHLRWNFVYQRPQHILSRFTKNFNVFYVEESIFSEDHDGYTQYVNSDKVTIVVPHLHSKSNTDDVTFRTQKIIDNFIFDNAIQDFFLWYYTPMALPFTIHLKPAVTVYDCMDELSAFKFAPPELKTLEAALFQIADIVFTGGNALYEAKKNSHGNIYPFPSSIDKSHFGSARMIESNLEDQKNIPHPRLGFFGVIDERFDIGLIAQLATEKPNWQFVIIGPVVKIDPNTLPKKENIHYLGSKNYKELPAYISGWDVALIPFLINESTKFISPTKTPEYLAAGKPVVSSAITDVINPYGMEGLVHIYSSPEEFIAQVTAELEHQNKAVWLSKADDYLLTISWDITCDAMLDIIKSEIKNSAINLKMKQNV